MTYELSSKSKLMVPVELIPELQRLRSQADTLRITITPVFKTRTINQNAIFHAKINEIAFIIGEDREVIKEHIKKHAMGMGYPYSTDKDGEPRCDKNGELIPKSSALATISEMTILIEALFAWAFDNGIYIGDNL